MSCIMLYVTFPDEITAQTITLKLLEERLIACANTFPIASRYRWKSKIENNKEIVALLKTRRENTAKVQNLLEELHPYETPCIIRLPVEANRGYEAWIQESTKPND